MPTRSAKLASVGVLTGNPPATLLTVPAGQTWIVKAAIAANDSGAAASITLYPLSGGVAGYIFFANALANGARIEWNGWLVLAPGDTLVTSAPAGVVNLWVSGTKLLGVA